MDTRTGKLIDMDEYLKMLEKQDPEARFYKEVMPTPLQTSRAKVGRNEPCPCGSGKKFKRCCLNSIK